MVILGRENEKELSLLEEMLICPYSSFIFKCAWDELRLWTKPEMLTLKNPMGKTLLDYALESDDPEQVSFLLMPKVMNNEKTFHKRKYYMVKQNSQYFSITGKCLIEQLLTVLMENDESALFRHFMYLLEEIGVMEFLKRDSLIEDLINLASSEDFFEKITGLMPYDSNEMNRKLFAIDDIIGKIQFLTNNF